MAKRRWLVWVLSGGLLAGCLGAGLGLVALQFASQWSWLPFGYVVLACAHVTTQPALRIEASWIWPAMLSSIIPTPPWLRGCVYLPWAPLLPPSGFWRFPP